MSKETNIVIKVLDFLLYSNIYIALCAVAMTCQTLLILDIHWKTSPALLGLVFFSTLAIYALHRLLSLKKVHNSLGGQRFQTIEKYKKHIQIYFFLSVLGLGFCLFFLNRATLWALITPALLSLAYVLPFLGKSKLRLRDVHYIKIFLIALVWAYVTVLLPLLELEIVLDSRSFGMLIERIFFIFMITLPFDLRDLEMDKHNKVRTIPTAIGVQNTLYLALFVFVVWLGIVFLVYDNNFFLPLMISGILTIFLVYKSPKQQYDYYFTGIIDGTMILQWAIVLLWQFL